MRFLVTVMENKVERVINVKERNCFAAASEAADKIRGVPESEIISVFPESPNPLFGFPGNIDVGARVFWIDPDRGISSGFYTVAIIFTEHGRIVYPHDMLLLKNEAGSEVEVFAFEISPA